MTTVALPKKGLTNQNFAQILPEVFDDKFSENILEVFLSNNNIENTILLDFFPNLLYSDLSKNTLKKIKKLPQRLTYINFSFNRIDTLTESTNLIQNGSVFRNLNGLIYLDLSKNEISILPEKVFQNCSCLQSLNLKSNKIRRIKNALGIISLEMSIYYFLQNHITKNRLNLSHNKIEDTSDFTLLPESPNLKFLYVNQNPFSEKQKMKQIFTHFKGLLPNLVEIDESVSKQIPEKNFNHCRKKRECIKMTPKEERPSKLQKKPVILKLGEIYGKMTEYHIEEKLNSARNYTQHEDDSHNYPTMLKQRRRSLSFAVNDSSTRRKNYPVSARNYEEKNNGKQTNLSEIHETNEMDDFWEIPRKFNYGFKFNEEIIEIQNKLIKEKNEEIWFWKNKYHLLEKEMKGGANHANLMRQKSKKEFS